MPAARRQAIGLILLYSNEMWDHSISVTTTRKDSNPNVPLRIATQFLIYEIVCGLRDPETFQLKSSNECGTAGDIFYNAGVSAVSYFAPNYNSLVSYVQAALEIPSFTSSSSGTAPVIQMNSEEISVYDSNGVLSDFSFTDKGGVEFYKSGNTLYITQTGTINESTVHTATKYIPSAENSTYCLWYMSGSTYQTTISLYSPESGSLNAYFKVKGPAVGNLSLTKTTEDGKNLSGWRFGIVMIFVGKFRQGRQTAPKENVICRMFHKHHLVKDVVWNTLCSCSGVIFLRCGFNAMARQRPRHLAFGITCIFS